MNVLYVTIRPFEGRATKKKRPRLARKKCCFIKTTHTSAIAMTQIHELGFKRISHPPYSPDLAPCDFFLLPDLKTWLSGKRFSSNEEILDAVNAYFDSSRKVTFLKR